MMLLARITFLHGTVLVLQTSSKCAVMCIQSFYSHVHFSKKFNSKQIAQGNFDVERN